MTPNKEHIRLWVDALRSGDYKQTTSCLTKKSTDDEGNVSTSHCCLGVACEVAIKNGVDVDVNWASWPGSDLVTEVAYDGQYSALPLIVQRFYGFEQRNPTIQVGSWNNLTVDAVDANDSYRLTFEQIAEAVEETYLT